MQRVVTAELDLELGSSVDLIFQIAAAQHVPLSSEKLTFTQGDRVYTPTEIVDQSGSRLHRLTGEAGRLEVRYEATVDGATASSRTSDLEAITYLRPSRYCQSDEVFSQARRQFRGLGGHELIAAVSEFVSASITYTPGPQPGHRQRGDHPHDGPGRLPRLRARRDLAAAGDGHARPLRRLLRAGPAARWTSTPSPRPTTTAPGTCIDATRLAEPPILVRIATGRDAADCAFLSYHGGHVGLPHMRVDAWVMPDAASADGSRGRRTARRAGARDGRRGCGIRSRRSTTSRR